MESNKDEAARAKEVAEKKFQDKDIMGAKRLALKAQRLFPGLDGLPQFLTTLDIYISAESKIIGEVDWYAVLGIDPSADHETVRKQYRKLALTLHPDKNKSVGAEGAFQIVSQAWGVLSDNTKRVQYDQKRRPKGIYNKVSTVNLTPSSGRNGFHCSASNGNASMSGQKSAAPHHCRGRPGPPRPHPQKIVTFWTTCSHCKMQYEYLHCYLNQTLLCPNCKQAFSAVEMPAPNTTQSPWSSSLNQQNSNHLRAASNFPAPGSRSRPVSATQANLGHLTKGHEATQHTTMMDAVKSKTHASGIANAAQDSVPGSALKGEKAKKKRHIFDWFVADHQEERANKRARTNGVIPETNKLSSHGARIPDTMRELLQVELRQMLMDKARMQIVRKLSECEGMRVLQEAADKEVRGKGKEKTKYFDNLSSNHLANGIAKTATDGVNFDGNKHGAVESDIDHQDKQKISSPADIALDSDTKSSVSVPLSMDVPDPDFHDFDSDRTESAFSDNQVWDAYDDDDGMPRYYAMIRRVVSRDPFKIEVSWLNSKSNAEFAPISWVGSGFYKTSGEFRPGRPTANTSINSFSHRVPWTKGPRGMVYIYPKKGDVWAIYRNWSLDWSEHTPNEVIHKYDMVEVLEGYSEEKGVIVVPLIKVTNFRTVFNKHLDPEHVTIIPREEMFRFSHQVPSYLLTGQESPNAPRGCRELDPAATPLELLSVTTETQEQVMEESAEEIKKST